MIPLLGEIVRYVDAQGHDLAAIVTEVPAAGTTDRIRVTVFTPDGTPVNRLAAYDAAGTQPETWHEMPTAVQAETMRHLGGQG